MGKTVLLAVLALLAGASCGGRGVLSTPKNQAGTRSVVLPGYSPAAAPASWGPWEPADAPAGWASVEEAAPPVSPDPGEEERAPFSGETLFRQERARPERIDLEIREKMFIAQTNDVYLNPEDYLGKTIRLEGLFKVEQYVGEDKRYCFVLRYGPGCCGNDGSAGFEVAWGPPQAYAGTGGVPALPPGPAWPVVDAWVEAVGTLDTYEEDGYPYLYLDLFSLAEMEKRGAEIVQQ
jgi:hypothetical protein